MTLTRQQTTILATVTAAQGRTVPRDTVIGALYPDPNNEPEAAGDVLKVQLCRLRKKLRGSGVEIRTVYGRGLVALGECR
jgi:DNA-binding response OmpR family regulator